jgi:transcriptional regulator with XRE-family HTH domain
LSEDSLRKESIGVKSIVLTLEEYFMPRSNRVAAQVDEDDLTLRRMPQPLSIVLTWLRERSGWTRRNLAAATGISKNQISDYERDNRNLNRDRLEELVAVMGYGPGEIRLAELLTAAIGAPTRDAVQALAGNGDGPIGPSQGTLRLIRQAALQIGVQVAGLTESTLLAQTVERRIANERAEAGRLWQRLARRTAAQRRRLVEQAKEFRGWALAERLAEESRRAAPRGAAIAMELARLAVTAAQLAGGSEAWLSRLEGFVRPSLANAMRVEGSLARAAAEWKTVWRLWHAGDAGDPTGILPEWRLLDLEASLRRDLREFASALDLLDRAVAAAPRAATGRILLNRASALEQAGDIAAAVIALRQAEPLVNETGEPHLKWLLGFNLSVNLCHVGAFAEAATELQRLRQLTLDLGNERDLLRVLWLSGRVAIGMGNREDGRAAFQQVREQLVARRDGFGTAMVSLELAIFYLEEGHLAEVRRVAREMSWILVAEGLEREAIAGLRLFCEAARHEAATVEQARTLLRLLDRSLHFGSAGWGLRVQPFDHN